MVREKALGGEIAMAKRYGDTFLADKTLSMVVFDISHHTNAWFFMKGKFCY
jgi:hypothetical protein